MNLENESFYSKLIKTNFKECQQSVCRYLSFCFVLFGINYYLIFNINLNLKEIRTENKC
jgi:hypothetical protein